MSGHVVEVVKALEVQSILGLPRKAKGHSDRQELEANLEDEYVAYNSN